MSKDSIVVFDEAHNIDNVCMESLSIELTRPMLDSAARNVEKLNERIVEWVHSGHSRMAVCLTQFIVNSHRIKETDASKLEDEYRKLVEGLRAGDMAEGNGEEDDFMANPGQSHV